MTAVGKRLERLSDDVSWFARATELRLHLVLDGTDVHEAVLRLVARGARIADRPVPYLLFVEPFAGAGAGWTERLQALESAYGTLRDELRQRGTTVATPPAPARTDASHAAFGARLAQWVTATAGALSGAVVTLAPDQVDAPDRFREELTALVSQPHLSAVRWVVVLPARAALEPLVAQLGASALVSDCVVPPAETAADLEKRMANAASAGPGASPMAHTGMAWPSQPPPAPKKAAILGPVTREDAARPAIRTSLLHAAVETRAGKGLDAVRSLRAAYDASARAGLADEQLATHLMLAATVATQDRALAIREYERAQAEGTALGRPLTAALAAQARAALQAGARQTRAAIETCAEAVAAARLAGEPAKPVLIDLLRFAGQLCVDSKMEQQGVSYWREAIALGEDRPPGVDAGGAVEAARALASLCRRRGLIDQASSLEAQATRLAAAQAPSAEAN